jgi:WD40 repeat protein
LITRHDAAVSCAIFLGDGQILATGGSDKAIQFWDLANGRQLHAMPVEGRVFGLGYSRETSSLGAATLANNVPSVMHYGVP